MARCAIHTAVTSTSSNPLSVSISTAAPPSISLGAVNPTAVALVAGGASQLVKVKLNRNNFTGSVSISVGPLPPGVGGSNVSPLTYNDGGIQLSANGTAADETQLA